MKKLGEGELEIMQVLWSEEEPVTAGRVLERLRGKRSWALSTLMTVLSRLGGKGFVRCDKSTGVNLYEAAVAEHAYKAEESRSFLDKLYGGSAQGLIATLYDSRMLGDAEIDELRSFLDELEEGKR